VAHPSPVTRYVPALDGVRGCAVAAVVLFHAGYLNGGYLGVDVFFVLSGFLITSLLLAESAGTGSIGLGHFWSRRARRLLPALAGVLLGVALYCIVFADKTEVSQIRGDAFATLGYIANWRAVFAGQDYWALFTSPSPLQHTWSLAIEEQFYLVWPLMFVGLLAVWKRAVAKAVLVTALALAAVATALMFVLYDPSNVSRVYYGTDTRAGGILLGAALAAGLALRGPVESRGGRRLVEIAAVVGVGVIAWEFLRLDGQSSRLYHGGFVLCEIAVVAVLAAVAHPRVGPIGRALSFKPLRLLGVISYGVYLWHWPVDVVMSTHTQLTGFRLFLLECEVTLAIATLSFFLLEQPIRRGAFSARTWRVAVPLAAGVLALVLVLSTLGARKPPTDAAVSDRLIRAIGEAEVHPNAERVMVVGNSVAWFLADAMKQSPADRPVVIFNAALVACYFPPNVHKLRLKNRTGGYAILATQSCDTQWRDEVEAFRPHIVLWVQSDAGSAQAEFGGRWVHPCQRVWDTNDEDAMGRDVRALRVHGATVAVATAAYSRTLFTSADREDDCDNRIRRRVAAREGARVVDLFTRVCPNGVCEDKEDGVVLRPDGLHYRGAGALLIARWVFEQLGINSPAVTSNAG